MPEAKKRGVAVLGMKSLGGSGEIVVNGAVTPEEGLRYAMAWAGEDGFVARTGPYLSCWRAIRAFQATTKYDGKVGREQHHYPPQEKLPA